MNIVTGLMDVLGLPAQCSANQKEFRNRRKQNRYEDNSSGDDEDSFQLRHHPRTKQDKDKTIRSRVKKQNCDDKASAEDLFDSLIGSCTDLREYYQEQLGDFKQCEGRPCQASPSRRNTMRPRSKSGLRSQQYKSSRSRSSPRERTDKYGKKVRPFSLGVGTEIPVGFSNDDVSAVTGVTLEEMAYRAQRQANNKKLIKSKMGENIDKTKLISKEYNRDDDTAESSIFPPSPSHTSTSSNVKDVEEYEHYNTTAILHAKLQENDNTQYNEYKATLTAVSSTTTEFESIWKPDDPTKAKSQYVHNSVPKEWEQKNSNIENLESNLSYKYRLPPPRGWTPRHRRLTSV